MEANLQVNLNGGPREPVEVLKRDLTYETAQEAERVGVLVCKLWIDSGKPALAGGCFCIN